MSGSIPSLPKAQRKQGISEEHTQRSLLWKCASITENTQVTDTEERAHCMQTVQWLTRGGGPCTKSQYLGGTGNQICQPVLCTVSSSQPEVYSETLSQKDESNTRQNQNHLVSGQGDDLSSILGRMWQKEITRSHLLLSDLPRPAMAVSHSLVCTHK